ncbi:hypothetical protein HanRHA438_Chr07g0321851 [Helianthus annuus]|nr:hypothetical protein HanRHA438_Chr07g0321851 [Helianthus annuus]
MNGSGIIYVYGDRTFVLKARQGARHTKAMAELQVVPERHRFLGFLGAFWPMTCISCIFRKKLYLGFFDLYM